MKIEDMQTQAISNDNVLRLFIMGQPGHAANLSTDGATLRSYHYYELAVWRGDRVILRAGELYSKTTKQHYSKLRAALDKNKVDYIVSSAETPRDSKFMEVAPEEIEDLPPPMFDRFDICAAYLAIEWDYHNGGILQERKSNKRRNMSTDYQLRRMQFKPGGAFNGYSSLTENGKAIYRNLEERYGFNKQLTD